MRHNVHICVVHSDTFPGLTNAIGNLLEQFGAETLAFLATDINGQIKVMSNIPCMAGGWKSFGIVNVIA